ncbi:MAG: metallopeptidase TldD-related protein [Xanthomonadales bacterium]|nr:metallopeptidase TldD-related protein [Xanthomonadales bacterium]
MFNLELVGGRGDREALLAAMGRGLLVTELMGPGVNLVTGDYSRGASGFWVEDGAIAHAVEEVTVAGRLPDMFRAVLAAGADLDRRGAIQCGSLLVDGMTVAGAG